LQGLANAVSCATIALCLDLFGAGAAAGVGQARDSNFASSMLATVFVS